MQISLVLGAAAQPPGILISSGFSAATCPLSAPCTLARTTDTENTGSPRPFSCSPELGQSKRPLLICGLCPGNMEPCPAASKPEGRWHSGYRDLSFQTLDSTVAGKTPRTPQSVWAP